MLSKWLRKAGNVTEDFEAKARHASRGYAASAIKIIATMAIGTLIAGMLLTGLILSPVGLGSVMVLPFLWLIVRIFRALKRNDKEKAYWELPHQYRRDE